MSAPLPPLIAESLRRRRWAVVGASPKPDRAAYRILHLLHDRGYDVTGVRPGLTDIDGIPVVARVEDLAQPPEVVDMVVNPDRGIAVLEALAKSGAKPIIWFQPGSESPEVFAKADELGLPWVEACVLVVLGIHRDARPE